MRLLKEIKTIYEALREEKRKEIEEYKVYNQNLTKAVATLKKMKCQK